MICPLHAWGDESIRTDGRGGPASLLGASLVDSDDVDATRAVLEGLRPTRGKLHWHDLNAEQRSAVSTVIGRLPARHVMVIGAPVDLRREERARARCLERLGWELALLGVTVLTLEGRARALEARDLRVVEGLRGRRVIPSTLRVEHGDPTEEPMLWLPDQVLGAYGRAMSGGKGLDAALGAVVQSHHVCP